jgi:hypothetical protein
MSCRRQAPTRRHANPALVGGSDDEAGRHRPVSGKSASYAEARGMDRAMSDTNPSNDDDSRSAVDRAGKSKHWMGTGGGDVPVHRY